MRPGQWHDDSEMTVDLAEQHLPPFAIDYVERSLLDGNALAKAVLEHVPLRQGQVVTCLPKGVVPRSAQDFRTGGKLPPPPVSDWRSTEREDELLLMIPVPTTDDWLVKNVAAFLRGGTSRVCIFEDSLKRVGDPVLRKISTRYATFNKEVYHLLLGADSHGEQILKVIRTARSIPTFVGILTEWPGDLPGSAPISLSPANMRALAGAAQKLVIGAFDGEGCLIWSRSPSSGTLQRADQELYP
jgi:hypothetical protein